MAYLKRKRVIRMPKTLPGNEKCAMLTVARVQEQLLRGELARRVGVVGNTIKAWEQGKMDPFMNCEAWANALGYDLVLVPRQPTDS